MISSKVLIVDDSLTNLNILSDMLSINGMKVISTRNGFEVMDILKKNRDTSLILLDIVMPKITGYDICKLLKQDIQLKDIPVILVTSLDSDYDKLRGFELGAVDYITKPYYEKEVIARAKTHVELFENRKLLNSKINQKDAKINELHQYVDKYVIFSQTDLKGNITYVSEAFCNISGYKKEELLNQPHNIVRHSDMPKEAFADLWETIQSDKLWQGEVKNKAKDGSGYWVYSRVTSQKDEYGNIIGYTSVRQDINQQKRAEELHNSVNNLLNNANEGFLSFNNDLLIKDGYSINSLKILNQDILVNKNISDVLFGNDTNKKEIFDLGISNIINSEDETMIELLLGLLPKENKIKDVIFTIDYKIIDKNEYMIILSDVTEKRNLEEKIIYENKIQKMIVVIATRKDEFLELKDSFSNFLKTIDEIVNFGLTVETNLSNITRVIHTYKGLLAQEELVNTPHAIHELENELLNLKHFEVLSNEKLLSFIKNAKLDIAFEKDLTFISDVLGKEFLESNPSVNLDVVSYSNIKNDLFKMLKDDEINKEQLASIVNKFVDIDKKSLKHMLDIYPKRIKNIAERLNKEIYDVEIIGDSSIQIQGTFNAFIQSLVHVFRNMIDHGIEDVETRDLIGKDYRGKVECSFYLKDDENIILTIKDDGKGIDINEIKEKVIKDNIYSEYSLSLMSDTEILKLIFNNNFSTNTNVDLLSGRGVGLFVVKNELDKIGGDVIIESKKNKGTEFIFTLPTRNEAEIVECKNNKELELSKVIVETAKEFVVKNINLEIENIISLNEFEIKSFYSVMKITLSNNVFVIISIDKEVFEKFLSFFIPDFSEIQIDEAIISSTIDEILNIIMGYAHNNFPIKFQLYELSPPLAMDKELLGKMIKYCQNYNYALKTDLGNINISTIFSTAETSHV